MPIAFESALSHVLGRQSIRTSTETTGCVFRGRRCAHELQQGSREAVFEQGVCESTYVSDRCWKRNVLERVYLKIFVVELKWSRNIAHMHLEEDTTQISKRR
jgi:hypothetical protein